MANKFDELPKHASVFLLGRYAFDIDKVKETVGISVRYDNKNDVTRVYYESRPDLNILFYTAHRSKGLQADYVFIINNKGKKMGFPSKVQNPPLVDMLLENAEQYPYAEERRLFYVALTRAKRKVYLVTVEGNISSFARDMINKYGEEMKKEEWSCPLCGGQLKRIKGRYGPFYGCSNYRSIGCRYTRKIRKSNADT